MRPPRTVPGIHLPRVKPGAVPRQRLLDRLDAWAPVTLLIAPSGIGKGVLAQQWATRARDAGETVLWFDGEVDDVEDLVAGLEALVAETPSSVAGGPRGPDVQERLRRIRRTLQRLPARTAVVVDNAESLLPSIGTELLAVVRDAGSLHLVLCLGRRLDVVGRALREVETTVLTTADLVFTQAEVEALARLHGVPCDPAEAERIVAMVSGWPALVDAGFVEAVSLDGDPGPWSEQQVAWFMATELRLRLSDDAWAALVRAGAVAHPTYHSSMSATGPLSEDVRVLLEGVGILDPSLGHQTAVVRLPPLLRRVLRERYDEDLLGPAHEVHDRVVAHWLEQGEAGHALDQAVEGRRWAAATGIIEEHWWVLLMEDPEGLVRAVGELPYAETRGHPRTEVLRQLLLSRGLPELSEPTRTRLDELRSLDVDDEAAVRERAGGGDLAIDLDLLALTITRARVRGDADEVAELATRTEALLRHLGGLNAAPFPEARRAALQAGTGWLLAGHTTRAAGLLQRAEGTSGASDQITADAAGKLALIAGLHGDRGGSRVWLERWRASKPPSTRYGLYMDLAAITAEALEAVQQLRPDDARASLARLRPDGPSTETWPFTAFVETQFALSWGGAVVLHAEIAAARADQSANPRLPAAEAVLAYCEADLSLSLGRTSAAARVLAEVDSSSPLVDMARARLDCLTGRLPEALTRVTRIAQGHHPTTPLRVEALLLAAWCHDLEGRPDDAALALERAVDTARRDRLLVHFGHVPTALLSTYAERVPVLVEIVAMLAEAGVQSAFALTEEPPPLTPRELAVLGCLVRGLSLVDTARELFVSRNTVKSQTTSIYRKLGAGDRHDAVRRSFELGLLE